MAGSHGRYMFKFLRNYQTAFHIACTILHSQQQCRRVLAPPFPRQPMVLSVFLILTILKAVYLIVVLICIPLMNNSVEYFCVLICHPYIFFGDVSVQILCSLFYCFFFYG